MVSKAKPTLYYGFPNDHQFLTHRQLVLPLPFLLCPPFYLHQAITYQLPTMACSNTSLFTWPKPLWLHWWLKPMPSHTSIILIIISSTIESRPCSMDSTRSISHKDLNFFSLTQNYPIDNWCYHLSRNLNHFLTNTTQYLQHIYYEHPFFPPKFKAKGWLHHHLFTTCKVLFWWFQSNLT